MNIKFADTDLNVRQIRTTPGKFRLGDILQGPEGMLLKVVTVQVDCPFIENIYKSKTVVLLETEAGTKIPVNPMVGEFNVYRRK